MCRHVLISLEFFIFEEVIVLLFLGKIMLIY
ncbi:hypothetical protein ACJIZ3_006020 [Penstemon smallii]|uniref:NADH dehydrogenase subunit 1 n=1 Tax=Penstemon smallii TaxID=265156 RepID=A0ABD3S6I5_9LAMI